MMHNIKTIVWSQVAAALTVLTHLFYKAYNMFLEWLSILKAFIHFSAL